MSARSEAALAASNRNDAARLAAVVQEEAAVKRLQAVQRVLIDLAGGTNSTAVLFVLRRIADAGGLYCPDPKR